MTEAAHTMKSLALAAAGYGVAGWMAENTFFGPRQSALFDGIAVPLLPSYAVGGTAVALLAPKLIEGDVPWYWRCGAYAVLLSGIEWAGCRIERDSLGACNWDYTGQHCSNPRAGCIDLSHAFLWGVLGLVVEKIATR